MVSRGCSKSRALSDLRRFTEIDSVGVQAKREPLWIVSVSSVEGVEESVKATPRERGSYSPMAFALDVSL